MTPSVEVLIKQSSEISGINEKTLPPVGTVFVLSETGAATLNERRLRGGQPNVYFPGQEFKYIPLPPPNPHYLKEEYGKTWLLFTTKKKAVSSHQST